MPVQVEDPGPGIQGVPELFGGASGLFLPIYSIDNRGLYFFYLMCIAAALAIGVTWWVLRSRFGYGLIAIRENGTISIPRRFA